MIVSFRQARAESGAAWEAFLRDLYEQGVDGEGTLSLIVTDGSSGRHAALDLVCPYVLRQRCWVHKFRNVAANKLPRRHQAPCVVDARSIYHPPTEWVARQASRTWAAR